MNKVQLGIVDDEKLIRDSLKIILGSNPEIEICGLCANGNEAYDLCAQKQVDVLLVDIRMPICDGVEGTQKIKRDFPDTKVLILTTFKDDEYIFDALKSGASGYLLKDTSPEIIMDAVLSVHKGNVIVHPEIAAKMVAVGLEEKAGTKEEIEKEYKLTAREMDIICGIGEGMSNKEIAKHLFLSEGTVKNHITEILYKLQLRDRTQIAIFAVKKHIV